MAHDSIEHTVASAQSPQVNRDEEHLRLLGLYHLIIAGFNLLALLVFIILPLLLGPAYMQALHMPLIRPEQLMGGLLVGGTVTLIYALNGLSLRKQRHRVSSMLMSVVECLSIPVGMILGISAILVLRRESVKALYQTRQQAAS